MYMVFLFVLLVDDIYNKECNPASETIQFLLEIKFGGWLGGE